MQGCRNETPTEAWQRKGKKYKTKYFAALKQLFGEIENDKDCQTQVATQGYGEGWEENCCPHRRTRSD